MSEPKRAISDEAALGLVVEGTASETGTEFFRALVKNLAAVMGTSGAWVTEYLPHKQRLRAYAFWSRPRWSLLPLRAGAAVTHSTHALSD
jgi:hypothetical protein